jgi:hypothetical protein
LAISGCAASYGSAGRDTYRIAPYPSAASHPTAAEQATTLAATEGYRRLVLVSAEKLDADVLAIAHDAARGRCAAARQDELAAQGAFDVLRPVIAPDSATAEELDGERWSIGVARFGGLHAIERALWTTPGCAAAGRLAAALASEALAVGFVFYRVILTPDDIVATAQSELGWAVDVPLAGREEQYSHHDLADVLSAVATARAALVLVAPLGRLVAPGPTSLAVARFSALDHELSLIGANAATSDGAVSSQTWRALATRIDGALAPLGMLSGHVAGFGSGRLYA